MKWGYKNKTSIFGSAAELYLSRLLGMALIPKGNRLPDLLSPDLGMALEVKSGRGKKGVLVDYQLCYGSKTVADYRHALIASGEQQIASSLPHVKKLPLYNVVLNRTDGVTSSELENFYFTIKLTWGNQFLVPYDWVFYAFAISRANRTGENIDHVIKDLEHTIKEDLEGQSTDYQTRKGKKQSWQNIHSEDIHAIFEDGPRLTTRFGEERIRILKDIYPELKYLKRVKIPGPNKKYIYILSQPVHGKLFDTDLRTIVENNTEAIEKLTIERERGLQLLKCATVTKIYVNGHVRKNIRIQEMLKLEKLVTWDNPNIQLTSF